MLNDTSGIDKLIHLQGIRRDILQTCIILNNRCDDYVARSFGYWSGLPQEERKATRARAAAMRVAVEKGGRGHIVLEDLLTNAPSAQLKHIVSNLAARRSYDKIKGDTEKDMSEAAGWLPASQWVKSVKGFGLLGLAKIIGETGDLSRRSTIEGRGYATKEKVWKRLGLAVINGERQQRKKGPEALLHRFKPERRAEVWIVGGSLLKAQWRNGKKEGVPPYALGPYGVVYGQRKAYTTALNQNGHYAERAAQIVASMRQKGKEPPKENVEGRFTAKHLDRDARRIMTKFLIENLWRVWNGKQPLEPHEIGLPRADLDGGMEA